MAMMPNAVQRFYKGKLGLWRAILGLVCVFSHGQDVAFADKQYATYYTTTSCKREGTSGVWTASGEAYDELAMTCALPHRDYGKRYRVCRDDQPSRCVVVQHNDYGPGKGPRSRGVVIDLSRGAFERLAPLAVGKLAVTMEVVP